MDFLSDLRDNLNIFLGLDPRNFIIICRFPCSTLEDPDIPEAHFLMAEAGVQDGAVRQMWFVKCTNLLCSGLRAFRLGSVILG